MAQELNTPASIPPNLRQPLIECSPWTWKYSFALEDELGCCLRPGLCPRIIQLYPPVFPAAAGIQTPTFRLEASWGTKIGVGSWVPVATGTTGGGRIQQLKDPARRFWLTRFGPRFYNSGKPDSATWGRAEFRALTIQCFSARRGARWSRAERVAGCHRPLRT